MLSGLHSQRLWQGIDTFAVSSLSFLFSGGYKVFPDFPTFPLLDPFGFFRQFDTSLGPILTEFPLGGMMCEGGYSENPVGVLISGTFCVVLGCALSGNELDMQQPGGFLPKLAMSLGVYVVVFSYINMPTPPFLIPRGISTGLQQANRQEQF